MMSEWRPLSFPQLDRRIFKGYAYPGIPRCSHFAGFGARMNILTNILMQLVHLYAQPSCSQNICNQALTSKNPVPDDAGFGITILPLYSGLK